MVSKHIKKVAALMAVLLLLVAVVASAVGSASAANLTGGTYTYVMNGEEFSFSVDPLIRKDGVLLPAEVFGQFGITMEGALTRSVILKKDSVRVRITVGSTTVDVNGAPATVPTAPMRLNGRLFLPADLLKEFAIEFSQDGTIVTMRDYADGTPAVKSGTSAEVGTLKIGRNFVSSVKADTTIYLNGEFTLLTPELVADTSLGVTYGMRARLQNLLQTNTLVLVKLSNTSFRAGAMVTSGLYLVDDHRVQYDLSSVLDIGGGLVSSKIAPGADRQGVLVYPRLQGTSSILSAYYDANNGTLGSFTTVR